MISASSTSRSGPHPIFRWLFSSIGKKTVVALTGIVLVAFVTGHLLGNFTLYLGQDWLNMYAEHLQSLGPILWLIRLFMLATVGTHVLFIMMLWMENQAARPKKYLASDPVGTTVFARTMRLSGLIVLAFLIFHLAHFTAQVVNPSFKTMEAPLDGRQVHDVYSMVVVGFRSAPVSILYIAGLTLLTMHLTHGVGSLFQTLGITNRRIRPLLTGVTHAYAWLLYLGYISIPISILVFGLGKGIVK
ncbi:MAG: succinate dehydrogenase cytochrome b subunit [Verrucomicrobiae bacterium]